MASEQLGRLAMRVEGDWWVAYSAPIGTMEGAVELGRVRMSIAGLPGQKDAGLAFFRKAFSTAIKNATGIEAQWPNAPRPAPEHERAGRS